MKFHVNSKTGRAGQCRATKKGCPLGSYTPHFESKAEAQAFIEKSEALKNGGVTTNTLIKTIMGKKIESKMDFDSPDFSNGSESFGDYLKGKSIKRIENREFKRHLSLEAFKNFYADEFFELSDGSALAIMENEGCGGCNAGNYYVTEAKDYPHPISKLEMNCESFEGEDYYEYDIYTLKAYSQKDKRGTIILKVEGTVGNGYYGEGYRMALIPAEKVSEIKSEIVKK